MTDTKSTKRVDSERALAKVFQIDSAMLEHATLEDVWVDGDDVVVEFSEPVGECPACGCRVVGTTAWNAAHDRKFSCKDGDCEVDVHRNEVEVDE